MYMFFLCLSALSAATAKKSDPMVKKKIRRLLSIPPLTRLMGP